MATLKRLALRLKAGNQTSYQRGAQMGARVVVSRSETWIAVFDGLMDPDDVIAACTAASTAFPILGYIINGKFVTGVTPQQRSDSPYMWDIKITYQTIDQPTESTTGNWNINIQVTQLAREETATEDGIGEPLWNTADVFLPQLPNDTLYDDQIVISWSSRNAPSWAGQRFAGKVNDGTVSFTLCGMSFTYTKYQLRCTGTPITCDKVLLARSPGSANQYKITYNNQLTFVARDPDWTWRAPNEGYEGYDPAGDGSKRVHFTTDPTNRYDVKGTPSTVPLKMDKTGGVFEDDSILWLPADMGDDDRYSQDGRFVIPKSADFSIFFDGIQDGQQIAPPA